MNKVFFLFSFNQRDDYCNSSLKHCFLLVPLMTVLVTKTTGVNDEDKTACTAAKIDRFIN